MRSWIRFASDSRIAGKNIQRRCDRRGVRERRRGNRKEGGRDKCGKRS